MTVRTLAERVERLCGDAAQGLPNHAESFDAIRRRLNEPLRVAIAGRVKAGKSTLLNALVGERLAPTDSGECTRIVTWYRYSPGYAVVAHGPDGRATNPAFRKGERALEIAISDPESTSYLEVGWPSRRLSETTFIDTPGLGSLTPRVSAETKRLLGTDGERPSQADAVIYLMRHAHAEDVHFLEGFRDSGLPIGSPVNTVAILSRADEIGGGRLDALHSAGRIAERYRRDERIRSLAGTVVPVSGLLAETAATLEESEYTWLRQVAAADTVDDLLLAVDRFRDPERNPLADELRERLLARFGLFGLRVSVGAIRDGHTPTSQALATLLTDISGVSQLWRVIQGHFTGRARSLIARSALADLDRIAEGLRATDPAAASRLAGAVEELVATAHELGELDLLHRIAVGTVAFSDDERAEAERLFRAGSTSARLGLAQEASAPVLEREILGAVDRWRQRGANPLTDRESARGCDVMARSYERLYAELHAAGQ